jgi:hypothetical protein
MDRTWLIGVLAIVPFAALRACLWIAQRRARGETKEG